MSQEVKNAEDTSLTNHLVSHTTTTTTTNPSDPANTLIEPTEKVPDLTSADNNDPTPHEDDQDENFPEGGSRAWTVVLGSFCGQFAVFGIINSTGVFQEYFSTHQLKDYSPSQIGWIFSLSLFLTFFCGLPIGPIFDARGPRLLIFCGSVLLVASVMLLGLCTSELPESA